MSGITLQCPEVMWAIQEVHLGSPTMLMGSPGIMGRSVENAQKSCGHDWDVYMGSPRTLLGSPRHHGKVSWGCPEVMGSPAPLGGPSGKSQNPVGSPGHHGNVTWECPEVMWVIQHYWEEVPRTLMGSPKHHAKVVQKSYRSSQYLWESIWKVQEYCWINPRHYEKVTWEYPEVMWVIPAWLKGLSGKFQNTTR
ncbi:hypothetical protein BU15DRAFT_63564 [Melanogaster broomeanus]|nr:hypothetical protein BU15DRAFT_63564 [Melanogaster broomeanus]